MTYKTIKIKGILYEELTRMKDLTNVPLSKLLEMAVDEFKRTNRYACCVLLSSEEDKTEK